jgi:hypothetical protein
LDIIHHWLNREHGRTTDVDVVVDMDIDITTYMNVDVADDMDDNPCFHGSVSRAQIFLAY